MIWLLIFAVVVLVAILVFNWLSSPPDEADYRLQADLHAIRRRLDVAQFKQELRRDALRMKRELRKELDE